MLVGIEGTAFTVIDLITVVVQPLKVTAYLMFVVPAVTPVTKPLIETEAMAVFSLDQVPPVVVFAKVLIEPTHIF